MAVEADR